MYVTAIIAAGGRGQRFGGAVPKQLLSVGGRPVLQRSVSLFVDHPAIHEIIVVLPAELVAEPPSYLRALPKPIQLVAGGARRQDSVANGFAVTSADSRVVVVHDAARPFATPSLVSKTIHAAAEYGAAVAAIAARDTVKRAAADDGARELEVGRYRVVETLPRDAVFLAQTPQAFRREVLRDALALGSVDATDEATLAERAGHAVSIVPGEATNIKITTREDVVLAEAIAGNLFAERRASDVAYRTGTGYDLHRLVAGRRLIIGGITVDSDRGALGHSDADVVCHAVTDALLGAGGLGDIGRHFPDTDPRWKDASSLDLLAQVAQLLAERGFAVDNVDATVVLERPKIKEYTEAMRNAVAGALRIGPDRVSIKGKTNEGVDAIGRGEAIAAHAVALLRVVSASSL